MRAGIRSEIERKLAGRMAIASRIFLWVGAAGILAVVFAFAHIQRWFTPTTELYFYTQHASGLSKGMAVKLIGFNIGSLEEISRFGELRVRGRISIASEHTNVISRDSRIRLTKEGVLGGYVLEILPGQGDSGPVQKGDTLDYERETDYSMMVQNLIDRIGPVVDDIRRVSSQLADPDKGLQATLKRLDQVGASFVEAGHAINRFGTEGSRVMKDVPDRIDPVIRDLQRNLAQVDSLVRQLNSDVPPMLGDSRKLLQSLTATSESLHRLLNDDVPRVLRKTESVVDDTDEVVGGVKRSWPVKNMLPQQTREKPVELDSADGAVHMAPRSAGGKP